KWPDLSIERIPPPRVPRHPALYTAARPRFDIDGHAHVNPQRHSPRSERESDAVSKHPPQAVSKNLAAIGVHAPDTRDVALQLAILDQRRNSRLSRQVSLNVEQRTDSAGPLQHIRWGDQVAYAKSRS